MNFNLKSNLRPAIILAFALVIMCFAANNSSSAEKGAGDPAFTDDPRYVEFRGALERLYGEIDLDKKVDQKIFELSMIGYYNLKKRNLLQKDSPITIIDYRKPSTVERLYVIDLESKSLLYSSLVAHGENTGDECARFFSNEPGSSKSSMGFYVTEKTYSGKHGYSLKLKGVDPPFNTNAKRRYIVIHGADYVSREYIEQHGTLGTSRGCPALPKKLSKGIIDAVRDGSCLFIYFDDKSYLEKSQHVNIETALLQFSQERKSPLR
jgi:hypothetical protein